MLEYEKKHAQTISRKLRHKLKSVKTDAKGGRHRPKERNATSRYAKGGDMNTLKRQGSYKTQYKLVSGFLSGHTYTALTANQLLETTRLTNNVIQCERDGLEIVHIEIPN